MSENLPQTIKNAVTGEEITFLETQQDTDGAHELVQVYLPPSGKGPRLHYHYKSEETFEVLDGQLKVIVDNEEKVLNEGETQVISKKIHHTFLNASDEHPVTFRVKVSPANNFEVSSRIMYGLIEEGGFNEQSVIKEIANNNPMYMAVILKMMGSVVVNIPEEQKKKIDHLAMQAKEEGIEQHLINKYARGLSVID